MEPTEESDEESYDHQPRRRGKRVERASMTESSGSVSAPDAKLLKTHVAEDKKAGAPQKSLKKVSTKPEPAAESTKKLTVHGKPEKREQKAP